MKDYTRREFLSSGTAVLGISATLTSCCCSPAMPLAPPQKRYSENQNVVREFHEPADSQKLIGQKVPELYQLNNNPHSLRSGEYCGPQEYLGKVTFLSFWASWCYYCLREFPDLAAFQEAHKEEAVVLALEADSESDASKANLPDVSFPLLGKKGKAPFAFTVCTSQSCTLYRKGEEYSDLGPVLSNYLYGIKAYPTLFVIDKEQTVREVVVGARRKQDLEALLKRYGGYS